MEVKRRLKYRNTLAERFVVEKFGENVEMNLDEVMTLIKEGTITNAKVIIKRGEYKVIGKGCDIPTRMMGVANLQDTYEFYSCDLTTYYDRDIYKKIEYWAENTDKILLLHGQRGVGKSYLLEKLGGDHFKRVIKVDFGNKKSREMFSASMKHIAKKFGFNLMYFALVFKCYAKNFINTKDTLIILDNVQYSSEIYNLLWYMRNTMNSKIAVTFLDICTAKNPEYFGVMLEMYAEHLIVNPLNFVEFLKAINVDLANEEKVKEAYSLYMKIGGYPSAVKFYNESGDAISAALTCKDTFYMTLNDWYECFDNMPREVIIDTFKEVAKDILNGRITEDARCGEKFFERKYCKNNMIDESFKSGCLYWLLKCGMVSKYEADEEIGKYFKDKKHTYFFNDMGFFNALALNNVVSVNKLEKYKRDNFIYLAVRDGYFDDVKFLVDE